MPHLPSRIAALHLQTLRRLFEPTNRAAWKCLVKEDLNVASGQYNMGLAIFAASGWKYDHGNIAKVSPFFRQLLRLWQRHTGGCQPVPPKTYDDCCSEHLWGNPLITNDQGLPVYTPSLAKCHYSTVGDVYCRPSPNPRTKAANYTQK